MILLHTIDVYKTINISPDFNEVFFITIRYLLILSEHFLFFFLFLSIFKLMMKEYKAIRLAFILLLGIMFVIQNIMFFAVRKDIPVIRYNQIALLLYYLILLTILSFMFIFLNDKSRDFKILYITGFMLFIVFLPFLIIDVLVGRFSFHWKILPDKIYFMSIFYVFYNIYCIIIGARIIISSPRLNESVRITEDFIRQNNLSERETEIIRLVINGSSNKEISDKLFISVGTVKTHLNNIFKKVKVDSRMALTSRIINSKI